MNEDRRRAPRHPLSVRVQLQHGLGLTKDISGVGVMFTTDVKLEANDAIEFTLAIPGAADVRCRGRVIRSSGSAPDYSVAATIEGYAVEGEVADSSNVILRDIERYHPQGWEWGE